jgi:hypothetical protein
VKFLFVNEMILAEAQVESDHERKVLVHQRTSRQ